MTLCRQVYASWRCVGLPSYSRQELSLNQRGRRQLSTTSTPFYRPRPSSAPKAGKSRRSSTPGSVLGKSPLTPVFPTRLVPVNAELTPLQRLPAPRRRAASPATRRAEHCDTERSEEHTSDLPSLMR